MFFYLSCHAAENTPESSAASNTRTDIQRSDQFLDVVSFLKLCATRLGIYDGDYPSRPNPDDPENIITVRLHDKEGRLQWYQVYDPDHHLMHNQTFTPSRKPTGGTRTVGFYSFDDSEDPQLCVKQCPEAPAYDIAIHKLYKALFPEDKEDLPVPASLVVEMNGIVFSISEFMEGETLEDVFKNVQKDSSYGMSWDIDIEQFQKLVIFSLLTNPEDCRPQNCLIRKIKGSNKRKFVLIDNERNLGKEYVEFDHPIKGKITTRVHCVLFFFDHFLTHRVDPEFMMRQRLNHITAIYNWIKECAYENQYQYNLRQLLVKEAEEELKTTVSSLACDELFTGNPFDSLDRIEKACAKARNLQKIFFGVYYNEQFIADFFEKAHKIHVAVHNEEGKIITLADIFWSVNPSLAQIYQIPFPNSVSIPVEINPMKYAFDRIMSSLDSGRAGPVAPASAYVDLGIYIGSTEALSEKEAFKLLNTIKARYELESMPSIDTKDVLQFALPLKEKIEKRKPKSMIDHLSVCLEQLREHIVLPVVNNSTGQIGIYNHFTLGVAIEGEDSFFHAIFTREDQFADDIANLARNVRKEVHKLAQEEANQPLMADEMVDHYQNDFEEDRHKEIPATLLRRYQDGNTPVHAVHIKRYSQRYLATDAKDYIAISNNGKDYGFVAIAARKYDLRIHCYRYEGEQDNRLRYVNTINDNGLENISVLLHRGRFYPLFNQEEGLERSQNVAQSYFNWFQNWKKTVVKRNALEDNQLLIDMPNIRRIIPSNAYVPKASHSTVDQSSEVDDIEDAKKQSLAYAEKQGEVGPRSIPGWELEDVEDRGNCFYDAVALQMKKINHPFLDQIAESTLPRDTLRLRIQGAEFQDQEWADHMQIDRFVRIFDVILGVVDTRNPEAGFVYYFLNEKGEVITRMPEDHATLLPQEKPMLKIAATGNHFLSVKNHP